MILSLVVVPAQASGISQSNPVPTPAADTLSWGSNPTITVKSDGNDVSTVEKGASLTFTVSDLAIKKGTADATFGTDYTAEYSWSGLPDGLSSSNSSTVTGTTNAAGTFNVKCTITIKQNDVAVENMQKEVPANVTVTDPQAAFEAAVKQATVTFKGRTYSANSGTTTFAIDLFGSETLPTSGTDMPTISVSDPYKSTTLVYTNSKWVAQYGTGGSALSCDVTLTDTKVTPDPTVTISNNLPVNTKAISGQKVSLTADYSRKRAVRTSPMLGALLTMQRLAAMAQAQHGRLRVLVQTRLLPSSFMKAGLRLQDMLRPTTLMPTTTKSRLSITRPLTRFRALLLSRFPLLHFTTRPLASA